VFRTLGHIFETTEDKASKGKLRQLLAVGTILMAVLKIAKHEFYDSLGSQQLLPKDALDFFRKHLHVHSANWFFGLCLTGEGLKRKENETNAYIMKKVGLASQEDEDIDINNQLSQFTGIYEWGFHSAHSLRTIFEKIERLDQWS